MPRLLKQWMALLVVLLIAGCSGGGCSSGCSSCGGVTPLAEGFKPDARIENAGAVRLTDSGLTFLEQNLGTLAQSVIGGMGSGGVITFEVPATSGSQLGIDYEICKNGPNPNANPPECVAEIDIGNAKLDISTSTPHNIKITGPLPLRIQKLPIDIVYFFIPDSATMVLNGNNACPNAPQDFANIDLDVNISLEIDTNQAHSRYGYTKIRFENMSVNKGQLQNSIDFCGGGFSDFVLTTLKGIIVDLLYDQLVGTLTGTLEEQLCQKANPMLTPACPPGSNDVNGTCRYGTQDSDECVAIMLGTDGHINLGQLLASLSPGTRGGLDFLFAAGGQSLRKDNSGFANGDLNSVAGGATIGLYGGAEPMPQSGCVPISKMAIPTGIPTPKALTENTPFASDPTNPWPMGLEGPHVGIALSERFTNYALNGVYNSGLLCIGITTASVDLLTSGTLSLVANSMKDLGIQQEPQQIGIVIRPQQPPTIAFGNGSNAETDPVMRVKMNEAAFDFYIFSLDRFIRFMTVTFDLDVPVNLVVTPEGLQPVITKLGVSNGKVTNSELLREKPETLAATLQDLIGGLVGQAIGGGISPIDLNSSLASLGLTLTIPESVDGQGSPGLRKLTEGTDNFLGIFATLGFPAMPVKGSESDTSAQLVKKDVDPAGVRLNTMGPNNKPVVTLQMASILDDGTQPIEYAYRVDNGVWHPFTRERAVDVDDAWLRMQGRHIVSVRSRVAGQPSTMDPTPASVEVLIDVEAPSIKIGREENGKAAILVKDFVSSEAHQVMVRAKFDDGVFGEWKTAAEMSAVDIAEDIETLTVEARDEEGNVASVSQAIIRGGSIPGGDSGCGCGAVGSRSSTRGLPALLIVALAVAFVRRPRANQKEAA